MSGPLAGIRVVDLGFWVAGPAAAGILADWGADVIKIEPPDGDPFRGVFQMVGGIEVPSNPPFELDNRGKRSIALNLGTADGNAVARSLLEQADVFVSNLRPAALARMGLDYAQVRTANPGLVYCSVTGYGLTGPEAHRAAYDVGAFWARAGVAASLVPEGADLPQQRGGMGDHTTAIAAAGAVCAALVARGRSGEGQHVVTSLLRTGAYVMGWDVATKARFGRLEPPTGRFRIPNPLINCYRSADGHWFWLLGLQGDRHWPDLLDAIARPDLGEDPRFADVRVRRQHAAECVRLLDEIFAAQPMAHWAEALDAAGMWWAPVQTVGELLDDPQARAAGVLVDYPVAEGTAQSVASPVDFLGTPWRPEAMTPEHGQHTEEILLELGYDWERIAALRETGAIF